MVFKLVLLSYEDCFVDCHVTSYVSNHKNMQVGQNKSDS